MAPKGKEKGPAPKKAAKTVDDKTFGMKNKKGAQTQRTIRQMEANLVGSGNAEKKKKEAEKAQREREKAAAEQAKRDMDMLINKPAQIQKVPFGVDPKTVLCIFFKKGNCEKGKKCKFSHDLNIERKTEKKDLYADARADEEDKRKTETSADWDEEKLRAVVVSKRGNQRTTTDKVCKFFIQAIEDGKYGWFWVCPNEGDKCKYKHALPPGFVLKTKEQRAAEKALLDKSPLKTLTLEEFLESERHKLTGTCTPVTAESFAKWKRERLDKKQAEELAKKAKEATGRALFESGKWRMDDDSEDDADDDDAWNLEKLRKETEEMRTKREDERFATLNGYVIPPEGFENSTTGSAVTQETTDSATADNQKTPSLDEESPDSNAG